MKTFSVITPVYNGQEYIANCINSVINAKYDLKKVEHIIVDDGSTDNTKKICQKFAKKYKHIKFYSKPNSNWGGTINYVKHNHLVHNDYVVICDADDGILPKAFEIVNKKCGGADMFCGSYLFHKKTKTKIKFFPYFFLFKRNFDLRSKKYFLSRLLVPNVVYTKKQVFYKGRDLVENVMYQDTALYNEIYRNSRKLKITNKSLGLYWMQRSGSTMTQTKSLKANKSWKALMSYLHKNGLVESYALHIAFIKGCRENVRNMSIASFNRKPHFHQYPWWIRFWVCIIYFAKAKKYITIKKK